MTMDGELRTRKALRRLGWMALGAVMVAGLLLWFAPSIVAHSSLLQRVIPMIAPQFAGTVSIGSASLGWLSPVVIRDVAAIDERGEPLLTIQELASQKPLWSLIWNQRHVGTLVIREPVIQLHLRPDGSNVEDSLAPLLDTSGRDAPSVQCSVEITDGLVEVVDSSSGKKCRASEIRLRLDLPAEAVQRATAKLQAKLQESGGEAGDVEAELSWQADSNQASSGLGNGQLAAKCQAFPLAVVEGLLRRFVGDVTLSGTLSSECSVAWEDDGVKQTWDVRDLLARDFSLAAPRWLGRDTVRFKQFSSKGQVTFDGDHAEVKGLVLDSDVGHLTVSAAAKKSDLLGGGYLGVLRNEDYEINGEFDLARLAQLLPATLRVREATQITSGKVTVALNSHQAAGQRRWDGRLETTDLAAVNAGQAIAWKQPLLLTVAAFQSPDGLVIEQLSGTASFLRLTGQAAPSEGNLSAEGDLDRLAAELDQFIDLGEMKLAGKLQARLNWRRADGNRLESNGDVQLQNFELSMPGVRPWRETHLNIVFDAAGVADQTGIRQLDSARLRLQSAADRLDVKLLKPVVEFSRKTEWPVECRLNGALASWLPRVQGFLPLSGWEADGTLAANATAIITPERLDVPSAVIQVEQLLARGPGMLIDEPLVHVETNATWDRAQRQFTSKITTMASSSLSFRADDVAAVLREENTHITGRVDYRGDLARLIAWTRDPRTQPQQHLFGSITGTTNFTHQSGVIQAQWSATIEDFEFARGAADPANNNSNPQVTPVSRVNRLESIWREKQLVVAGQGTYDPNRDVVSLSQVDVKSGTTHVTAKGQIAEAASACRVDLSGQVQYDLAAIVEKLRPYLGSDIEIVGRDARQFTIRGPLFLNSASGKPSGDAVSGARRGSPDPAETSDRKVSTSPASISRAETVAPNATTPWPADLTAQASAAWQSIQYRGFQIGSGELQGSLSNGVVDFRPLDLLASGGGRLKLTPHLVLNPPMTLVVDKGAALERVQISPDVCRAWLKFVAPLLADATQAQGSLSVNHAAAEIPLAEPMRGTASGVLSVHSAQVGPGPMSKEFLWLAQQVKAIIERRPLSADSLGGASQWVTMPAQEIPFEMLDGRVYHRGLELIVQDVVIRTRGSVGLDESLSLLAEIPIQDQWIARDRMLTGLKGQVVQIPFGGTLGKPQVDSRALQNLTKQMIGGAAGRMLEDELNRGLDRLFRPGK